MNTGSFLKKTPISNDRKILHADMDAFFASVEQLDNPNFAGKPVIVGSDPKGGKGRGVVAACSYEARKFGIHSAMPIGKAWALCPKGIYLRPRLERYALVSQQIFSIFLRFTDLVEPVSVDEAFLDLTGSQRLLGQAEDLARQIKSTVFKETGLSTSVGLAPNKFLAKIASDLDKPDGFLIVDAHGVKQFLDPLPISKLWGVGPKSAERLKRMGINSIGDLLKLPAENLKASFNKAGEDLYRLARGIDDRPVSPGNEAKSIGAETTFSEDVDDREIISLTILSLAEKVAKRLRGQELKAGSVTLKHRDENFNTTTRSMRLAEPSNLCDDLRKAAMELLARSPNAANKTRLLGITATGFIISQQKQLGLFENKEKEKKQILDETMDEITKKFGPAAIARAALLRNK